jgi:hypothetical protein
MEPERDRGHSDDRRKLGAGLAGLVVKVLGAGRVRRVAVAGWMNCLIAAVIGVGAFTSGEVPATFIPDPSWPHRALTVFAIWLLSFMPGWLYIRFLCLRRDALWNEYVLNLYRLGLDEPRYLPPPPIESGYDRLVGARDGGAEQTNIYRQKFNAFYGRKISASAGGNSEYNGIGTLFPVFLCTVTLAVAWTVILWNPVVVMTPVEPWATLQFGFLGAYTFSISMLIRRFYQSDLRPSAYVTVVVRIVVVLVILAAMHQLFSSAGGHSSVDLTVQYVVGFVVGFFPLVGLQALQRTAAKVLRIVVPTMAPEYPLDQLDGLNIWYEARLVEEGVEDMQNLATVNLVEVILHTRAPVGRLIDWIDQAYLLIHLNPASRKQIKHARKGAADHGAASTRVALRHMGIRSATDLLRVFDPPAGGRPAPTDEALLARGLEPAHISTLVALLAGESGLDPVWNWKEGGSCRVPPRVPLGKARSGLKVLERQHRHMAPKARNE